MKTRQGKIRNNSCKICYFEEKIEVLKYILDQDINSMIRRVYADQTKESIKGDFTYSVTEDLKDLEIKIKDSDIKKIFKGRMDQID